MSNPTSTGGIADALAREASDGTLDTVNAPKLPSIPGANTDDVAALRRTIMAMKTLMDVREGRSGSAMDKHLTLRDMLDGGLTSLSALGRLTGGNGTSVTNISTGGSGGGGGGYQDLRPIYATPPTITGLAAQGVFKTIILTWTMTAYANHAYVEVWRSGTDALGTAALNGTTVDGNYVDASGALGATYYYWVRAVNIEGTAGSYNAVSGVSAGLLKIGSTDLGPLVVLAGNLADGSVTAAKVLAGQLDATKFASSIEPITLVPSGSLPTVKSTTTIYFAPDGKLYKWNGSAYSPSLQGFSDLSGSLGNTQIVANTIGGDKIIANTLDAGKIVANSITSGQIQAGAIRATELAAGAVTTDKLLVTGRGAALNDDPGFTDPAAWDLGTPSITFGTGTTAAGAVGSIYLRAAGGTTDATAYARAVQIDPAKTYSLTASLYADTGNNRNIYLFVDMYDAAGAHISGATTGWGGTLSGYVYGGLTPPGVFTRQGAQFGAGTPRPIPANAATVRVGVWFQYSSAGSSSVTQACQDLRLAQAVDYSLIVDGAIIAGKIAANAIVAGDGVIQNAAITNALIANLAVDDAKIANLNVSKVTAGTMNASFITAGTITADRMLTGLLSADNVLTRNLTVRDASGTVLLGTGVNLASTYISPAAGWLNSNVTLSASGVLSGGSGAVTVAGLDNTIVRSGFPINPGNVTTYIAGAAIGLANINTASIGSLSALSADMGTITAGTITLNSAGYIQSGQTAWATGSGFWLGYTGTEAGFSIGNGSEYLRYKPSTGLEIVLAAYTAGLSAGAMSVGVSNGDHVYGTRTVTPSGGSSPYTYEWYVANQYTDPAGGSGQLRITGATDVATIGVSGYGTSEQVLGTIRCIVRDSRGRTANAQFNVNATHS